MDNYSVGPDEESALVAEIRRLTEDLDDAYQRERATRISLLRLHALMGICVGCIVIFTGTAAMFETDFGVWVRPAIGGLALVSGIALYAGLQRRGNRFYLEIIGLILMGLWDILMAAAIVGLVFSYDKPWVFPLPGTPTIPAEQPRIYAVMVYLILGVMVWGVHLRAVLTDRKQHTRV